MSTPSTLAAYLHFAFCAHRCSYCDFNTYTSSADLIAPYLDALTREITLVGTSAPQPFHIPTIFFGGGTPSLMPLERLAAVLTALRTHFDVPAEAEITLEANPGTVDAQYLVGLAELGVNRISFGVQSAQSDELALLQRIHNWETAVAAVENARAAGFSARRGINVDLIFGLPYQTLATWSDTLERALALAPEHISLYCLTLEHGTRMYDDVQHGRLPRPDDDLAADMYEYTQTRLADTYEHYEISNWARPGYACQHNLVYWRNEAYLAFGAGAHGSYNGWRFSNVLRPRRYIGRVQAGQSPTFPYSPALATREAITTPQAMGETMMLGLRLLNEGVAFDSFAARYGRDLRAVYPRELSEMTTRGLLECLPDRVRLTPAGRLLGNKVFAAFLPDPA